VSVHRAPSGVLVVRLAALIGLGGVVACADARPSVEADTTGLSADDDGDDDGAGSEGDETGGDEGTDETGADALPPPEVPPGPGGARRLRSDQYTASIATLLGVEAAAEADPPQDQPLGGFDAIGASELALSPSAIEQYERSALAVADAAIEHPSTLAGVVPCVSSGPHDDACLTAVARDFGALAWRRQLEDAEVAALLDVGQAATAWAGGDVTRGAQYIVATILQSPDFLYVVELGEDDGGEFGRRLTDRELVTRMSLFVLGHVPDATLLARADAGELATEDGLRELAEELVQRPDARMALLRFFDELLRVRELPLRTKDPLLFPGYTPELASSLRDEALLVVSEVVLVQDASFLDLFTADFTFVDPVLAAHYGLPAPASGAFEKVDLPAGESRIGLTGLASFSALLSHPDRTSPTRRGLFIQKALLCNDVPPPPGDLDTSLPEPTEPTTLRARMEQHVADAQCAACHLGTDPIGFAFESFDATGAFRTLDNGFPIDTTGEAEGFGAFADAAELAAQLREHPGLAPCLVKNLYRHSIGHLEEPDQADAIDWLVDAFVASDHNVKTLAVELMTNPVFRRVGDAK
jgi:hypothetical protein